MIKFSSLNQSKDLKLRNLQAQQPKVLEEWEEELPGTVLELADVDWTSDDPDPVAISRLKKNGSIEGILEERVAFALHL